MNQNSSNYRMLNQSQMRTSNQMRNNTYMNRENSMENNMRNNMQNNRDNSLQNDMRNNRETNCRNLEDGCMRTDNCIDEFPIGMAYIPWQSFRDLYDPHEGLERGTLFKELDYPFLGKRGNW